MISRRKFLALLGLAPAAALLPKVTLPEAPAAPLLPERNVSWPSTSWTPEMVGDIAPGMQYPNCKIEFSTNGKDWIDISGQCQSYTIQTTGITNWRSEAWEAFRDWKPGDMATITLHGQTFTAPIDPNAV